MKYGCLISFWIWAAVIAIAVLVAGCAALPTLQHCDEVSYTRTGTQIEIHAKCRAPVGGGVQL